MKQQARKWLAVTIAVLMTLTSLPVTPVFGEEIAPDEYILDAPAEFVEFTEEAVPNPADELFDFDSLPHGVPLPPFTQGGEFSGGYDENRDSAPDGDFMMESYVEWPEDFYYDPDAIMPFFIGVPPAPVFDTPGGVHSSAINLGLLTTHGASVRFTRDGSVPVVCAAGGHGPACLGSNTTGARLSCGCSPLWPGGNFDHGGTINVSYRPHAGAANSPMTFHGVGRANPAPWNVGWNAGIADEDSSYVSPNRVAAQGGRGGTAGAPAGGHGYFVPNAIYNASVIRARAFDLNGEGGRTATSTFVVNRANMSWDGVRIVSVVTDPDAFTHPIQGLYRNWDRGMQGFAARANPTLNTGPTPRYAPWINNNFYNWESQIRAGMWDGLDWYGNPAPVIPNNARMTHWGRLAATVTTMSEVARTGEPTWTIVSGDQATQLPGNNNGQGWGLFVGRHTGNRATCGFPHTLNEDGSWRNSCTQHIPWPLGEQDGARQVSNVEVFGEDNSTVVNQLARVWVFGNWTRFFPIRSIRINFNQGDGDLVGVPNLIPNTRRHFYAANEALENFRHINLRTSDIEGTDTRDAIVQRVSHPLRPTVQNATFSALFINGEFWGMYSTHTHRHEHLLGEVFGVPRGDIEMIADGEWVRFAGQHIFYPVPYRGIRTDNANSNTGGFRRTALGRGDSAGAELVTREGFTGSSAERVAQAQAHPNNHGTEANHSGYARRVPTDVFPADTPRAGHPIPAAWQGATHLTQYWFDYINTIICMDDLIDMFIIGMHFENWDWISNNFETWRTTRVTPGVHGADGRLRFIVQDFDNAVFHGANDMLTFFTSMHSPLCRGTGCDCRGAGATNPCVIGRDRTNPEMAGSIGTHPVDGLPFEIFELPRTEDASRIFRILLQNPTFRNRFAARYSTYTGTAFHPSRVMHEYDFIADRAHIGGGAMGRHHVRWGMFGGGVGSMANGAYGPYLVPWLRTDENFSARVGIWDTGPMADRWTPHTLRGGGTATPGGISRDDRGQMQAMMFRAAGTDAHNAIDHIRQYLSQAAPTGTIATPTAQFGRAGREHNPVANAAAVYNLGGAGRTLGGVGAHVAINWQIGPGTGDYAAGLVGWLDVAGAHIRRDLYQWGDLEAYSVARFSFPGFQLGNFTARYLHYLPITVTANDHPGNLFTGWTLPAGVQLLPGYTLSDRTIQVRPMSSASGTTQIVRANFNTAPPATAIIHQIYGLGATHANHAISHSFIELYNPWDTPVSLANTSLQIQHTADGVPANLQAQAWEVFSLTDPAYNISGVTSIPPRTSFLITSRDWNNPAGIHVQHTITAYDMSVPFPFSNRNISVALVGNRAGTSVGDDYHFMTPLPEVNVRMAQRNNYVHDLVAAVNDPPPRDQIHNVWGPAPARRISRNSSTRRIWVAGEVQNTRDNWADFEEMRFGDMTALEVTYYRPRSLADGAWPDTTVSRFPVTIEGGIEGHRATPSMAAAGTLVTLRAGIAPPDMAFYRWSSDVTIIDATSPDRAFFIMPARPVTVTANFADTPPFVPGDSLIINQIHGQGSWGTNAVSHGFIELFNPTDDYIDLSTLSLQARNRQAGITGTWHKLLLENPLRGTNTTAPGPADDATRMYLPPNHTFLVVSRQAGMGNTAADPAVANTNPYPAWYRTQTVGTHRPRHIIDSWDMEWALQLSNNSLAVAIVDSRDELLETGIPVHQRELIVDLVGALNAANNNMPEYWGEGPAIGPQGGISRQASVRRINFSNTGCNYTDFERIDFRYPPNYANHTTNVATNANGISNPRLQQVRPRWSGDGEFSPGGDGYIFIENGGRIGAGVTPNPATPGTTVRISAGYNDGYEFQRWEVVQPTGGVITLANANARITSFNMPTGITQSVILRAIWDEMYNVTILDGRAPLAISGAGTYEIGERVVIFAGTRVDGYFFQRWEGMDIGLLNDTNAAIAYFYMPPRNVTFTARWSGVEGAEDPFPMTLVGWQNDTRFVRAGWGDGHRTDSGGAANIFGLHGGNMVALPGPSLEITGPGQFSLGITMAYPNPGNNIRWDQHANHRVIHVTVAADGTVTSPSTYRRAGWGDAGHEWHNRGRISTRPGSNNVYVSYNTAAPQIPNSDYEARGIPAGHEPHRVVDLFYLNVANFNGVSGVTTNPVSGLGRFPAGVRVAINAGEMPGESFIRWEADHPDVVFFNPNSAITSFIMPDYEVTVTASFGDLPPPPPSIIINQIYGRGAGTPANAVSHSFIELYNPTNRDIDISGWSLQIAPVGTGNWQVIPMPARNAVMEAGSSFLVVSSSQPGTNASPLAYTIANWDVITDVAWGDRALSVALVSRLAPISSTDISTRDEVLNLVDLVGANFGTGTPGTAPSHAWINNGVVANPATAAQGAQRLHNQFAARRVNFANTRVNSADFVAVNYTTADVPVVRPRWSGDGAWTPPLPAGTVLIADGGVGASVSPISPVAPGTITINAGTRVGQQFVRWQIDYGQDMTAPISFADPTASTTTFVMPAPARGITVRAVWEDLPPTTGVTILAGGTNYAVLSGETGEVTTEHPTGDRVIISAGTGASGYYFNRTTGWQGPNRDLLADPLSPITYFTMPDHPVTFIATWERRFTPLNWPMAVRVHVPAGGSGTLMHVGHAQPPAYQAGNHSGRGDAVLLVGGGSPNPITAGPRTFNVTGAGQFTATLHPGGSTQPWGVQEGAAIRIRFTVAADGGITINQTGTGQPWGMSWTTPGAGRVWRDGDVVVVGTTGAPGGADTSLPGGASLTTYAVTVTGTHNVTVAQSGAGTFPPAAGGGEAAHRVSINAGVRHGYNFVNWTSTGGSAVANVELLDDATNPVASFLMPSRDVTFVANWAPEPVLPLPTVTWPTNLSVTSAGQMLSAVSLPGNGSGAGTFSWVADPATTPVGGVGAHTHTLRFTPTGLFRVVYMDVIVTVPMDMTPPVIVFPTASTIVQGTPLSGSIFTGYDTAGARGWFDWVTPDYVPLTYGTQTFAMYFVPQGSSIADFNWAAHADLVPGSSPPRLRQNVTLNITPTPTRPALSFPTQNVVIHQVYGHGATPTDNAVSHGFIELRNLTDAPISLSGHSIQIQNIGVNTPANFDPTIWNAFSFGASDVIPANGSFLILSTVGVNAAPARLVFNQADADMLVDVPFSNANMSVALVYGAAPLSPVIHPDIELFGRVVDLIGVQTRQTPLDRAHNYLGEARRGTSQHFSARRTRVPDRFELFRNMGDFEVIDFRYPAGYAGIGLNAFGTASSPATSANGITNQQMQQFRPRHSGEMTWATQNEHHRNMISFTGVPASEVALSPGLERAQGNGRVYRTTMTITVDAPLGQRITNIASSGITPPITFTIAPNGLSAIGHFLMPDAAISAPIITRTLTAADAVPSSIVINQLYGRAFGLPYSPFALSPQPAVNRGFIEIYNPTTAPVDLSNYLLQVQNVADGATGGHGATNAAFGWHTLHLNSAALSGTTAYAQHGTMLLPNHSALIVTSINQAAGVRYVIPNYDAVFTIFQPGTADIGFSNRNFTARLTRIGEFGGLVDEVGTVNGWDNGRDMVHSWWGIRPAIGISNQQSVRRLWDNDTIRNNRRNSDDFEVIRFAAPDPVTLPFSRTNGISFNYLNPAMDAYFNMGIGSTNPRPRWRGDGEWTEGIPADVYPTGVAIYSNIAGVVAPQDDFELQYGANRQLIATLSPGNVTERLAGVTWSSDNEAVATVSENGLVTVVATSGYATIAVTTVYGTHTDTVVVTATMQAMTFTPDQVQITDTALSANVAHFSLGVGTPSLQFTVPPALDGFVNVELGGTDDAPIIVTGTRPTLAQGLVSGDFDVTVTRGNAQGTFTVNVNLTPLPELTFTPSPVVINDDNRVQQVTVTGGFGAVDFGITDVAISAELQNYIVVGRVGGEGDGYYAPGGHPTGSPILITGTRPVYPASDVSGSFSITVSRSGASPTVLTVNVNLTQYVPGVDIVQDDMTLSVGDSATLTVLDGSPTWSSDSPGVATVSPTTGEVVAVATGSAVITATVGGQTDTITITVTAPITFLYGGDGAEADPIEATAGELVTLTPGTRLEGGYPTHRFSHWASGDITFEGNTFYMPAGVTGVEVTGVWNAYFTVTVGHYGTATPAREIYGEYVNLDPGTAPASAPGTYFLYWVVVEPAGFSFGGNRFQMPAGNVVLTPVFGTMPPGAFSITINPYDTDHSGFAAASYAVNTDPLNQSRNPASFAFPTDIITLNPGTRDGYNFIGWTGTYVYATGSSLGAFSTTTPSAFDVIQPFNGTISFTANADGDYYFTMPQGAVTLDTTWEAVTWTVRFDLAGGALAQPLPQGITPCPYYEYVYVQTVNHGGNAVAPGDALRAGFDFGRWSPTLDLENVTSDRTFTVIWSAVGDATFNIPWAGIEWVVDPIRQRPIPANPNANDQGNMVVEVGAENAPGFSGTSVTISVSNAAPNVMVVVETYIGVDITAPDGTTYTVYVPVSVSIRTDSGGNGEYTIFIPFYDEYFDPACIWSTFISSPYGANHSTADASDFTNGGFNGSIGNPDTAQDGLTAGLNGRFLLGDTNGDGVVTSADATLLARWLMAGNNGTPVNGNGTNAAQEILIPSGYRLANAEMRNSGLPTVDDLTLLAQWLVGHSILDQLGENQGNNHGNINSNGNNNN